MQPDPGLLSVASSGALSCVHQSVHFLYVDHCGQVSILLSAVCLGLRPRQGCTNEVVLVRGTGAVGLSVCGRRTLLFIRRKSSIVYAKFQLVTRWLQGEERNKTKSCYSSSVRLYLDTAVLSTLCYHRYANMLTMTVLTC